MSEDRVWATCEICHTTTNPQENPYGPRSNSDVRVLRTGDGVLELTLGHGFCFEEGFQGGMEQFVAGGEA